MIIIPNQANAFWFFTANVDAATNTLAGSQVPVLAAAKNLDPNPNKGLTDLPTSSDNALIAHSGLSGTSADIANIPNDRISIYVVRPGDTLSEIATMFDVSVNTIIWANNLNGTKDFHTGDTLIILPISGIKYTVAKKDTLRSIAKKYGADANEIAQFNGIDPDDNLTVGTTIIIPGGEATVSAPAAVKGLPSIAKNSFGSNGPIPFGFFSNPIPGGIITQGLHDGKAVDIGARRSTTIHAAAEGTVIIVRNNDGWNGGYGNYVVITHKNGTQTLYAHLQNVTVTQGQRVADGQIIGSVGMTGRTTGPHLHFEVRGAGNPFRNCSVGSICEPQ